MEAEETLESQRQAEATEHEGKSSVAAEQFTLSEEGNIC